jgi:PAS domain-containing protein
MSTLLSQSPVARSTSTVLIFIMKITIDKDNTELLRTLDVLNLPAFIVDSRWTILSCNDAVAAFFKYERSEVIGRSLDNFVSLDDISAGSGRAGDPRSFTRSFCFRKNGSPLASHISIIPNRNDRPDRNPGRSMPPAKAGTRKTGAS